MPRATLAVMISDGTITAIRDFSRERGWDQYHTPDNLAKSICIEAAELLECFQWSPAPDAARAGHVRDELADVLTYCVMMADALGCDMDDIILSKLERTRAKYPAAAVRGDFDEYERRHLAARLDMGRVDEGVDDHAMGDDARHEDGMPMEGERS